MSMNLGIMIGIGSGNGGGGGEPAPFSLVIAGNRFDVMTGTNSLPNPYTSKRHHYVGGGGNVTNIQAIDVNWVANANGTTTATSARTIKKFIEYPVGSGTFHQFTWGGSTTVLIPAGGVVQSDTLLSSVDGQPLVLTANDVFNERTVNLTVVTDMPNIVLSAGSTVLGIPDGNVAADQGNSGTIAATTGTRTFGSIAMIGRVNGTSGVRSFLLTADSLGWGQSDATSASSRGSIGFPWRTLDKYNFPGVKIAVQGMTAAGFAGNIANANMVDLMSRIGPYITDGWNELGINDIGGSGTPTSIKADWQTIYGAYFSGKTIHQSTLTMRNDSSDSFATDANQTIKVQGNMSLWAAFNDEIRLGLPNVDHIIDAQLAAAANPTYPNNWSGPPYPMVNADGVHILSAKAAAMATAITIV